VSVQHPAYVEPSDHVAPDSPDRISNGNHVRAIDSQYTLLPIDISAEVQYI
jgi:hypothetical protein